MEEPSDHNTSGGLEHVDSNEVGPLDADLGRSISSASLVSSGGHSRAASSDINNLWAPSPSFRSRAASIDLDPLSPEPEPRTSSTWSFDGRSRCGSDARERKGSDEVDPRTPSTGHGSSATNMDTGRLRTSETQNGTLFARSTPRNSISVQNVVIPAYLVRHAETSWDQDKIVNRRMSAVRTDSRDKFNVETIARDQQNHVRAASIAVGVMSIVVLWTALGLPSRIGNSVSRHLLSRTPYRKTPLRCQSQFLNDRLQIFRTTLSCQNNRNRSPIQWVPVKHLGWVVSGDLRLEKEEVPSSNAPLQFGKMLDKRSDEAVCGTFTTKRKYVKSKYRGVNLFRYCFGTRFTPSTWPSFISY